MLKRMNFSKKYHKILCKEFPAWLNEYLNLKILQRLKGIGLLCGTDWTKLYSNCFFYSRFDHSLGTALITWNFTKDKVQTLASLFHDIATAAFSHVNDFRNGDALKQEFSEGKTQQILQQDIELNRLLERDGIPLEKIANYHDYPVCDNEIPRLSSDRLEYMFPSNMSLSKRIKGKVWTLKEAKKIYSAICILKNEDAQDELGFTDIHLAELYTKGFCDCALILQKNENKIALNMLGKIVNTAIQTGVLSEDECFYETEKILIKRLNLYAKKNPQTELSVLIKTWRTMKKIERFKTAPSDDFYFVNLQVKKRYIDPLVIVKGQNAVRLSSISRVAQHEIQKVLTYNDAPFAGVKLLRKNQS